MANQSGNTRSRILRLLTENEGHFISGQRLAEELGISRNAIWKAISQLKEEGYLIESRTNAGYCLTPGSNLLTRTEILSNIHVDCDVRVLDSVTSTNDLMKEEELTARPKVIIANKQTQGRGRLGRSFISPGGTGVYMTFGLKPDFDIDKSPFVTMSAAVAVCRAIEQVAEKEPSIKWVNDIFVNNRKICGILTEAQTNFETGEIDRLIIGIGVNCFPGSFPPEIRHIAGPISEVTGSFSRSRLAAAIVNEQITLLGEVPDRGFLDEYRRRCFILGQNVVVRPNYDEQGSIARALSITDDGGLVVEYLNGDKKGKKETLHTGEISIGLPD